MAFNISQKTMAWVYITVWALYVVLLYVFYPVLENIAATSNFVIAYLAYAIAEPHIVFIFIGITLYGYSKQHSIIGAARGAIAGILVALATDQASAIYCVTTQVNFQAGINALCSDYITIRELIPFLGFDAAKIAYYIVIPILEVVLALIILKEVQFGKLVKTEVLRK